MKKTGAAVTLALALSGIGIVGGTGVAGAAPVSSASAPAAPVAAPAAHVDAPQAKPMSDADRSAAIDSAVGAVGGAWAGAAGDGLTVGSLIGLAVGCPLGALTGGSITVLATAGTLTPLGVIGGCIIGASGLSLLGGIVGQAVNGFPAAIIEGNNQFTKLHAAGAISAPIALPAAAH